MPGIFALAVALQALGPAEALELANEARAADAVEALEARWLNALERDPEDQLAAFGLAATRHVSYRYDRAADLLTGLLDRGPPDATVAAYAAYLLGAVEIARANFPAAASSLDRAVQGAEAIPDSVLAALALSARSAITARLQGRSAAIELADRAARWLPAASSATPVVVCNRAAIDPRVSATELEQAADRARSAGQPHVEGRCRLQLVVSLIQRGATDSVFAATPETIDRLAEARDYNGLSTALQWIGYYERIVGEYAAAESRLLRAVEIGTEARNASAVAWSHLNLAALAESLGDVAAGVDHARRAADLLGAQGDVLGLATVRGLEGRLWMTARAHEQARAAFVDALQAAERLDDTATLLGAHANLGELAERVGDFEEAERRYRMYEATVRERRMTAWEEAAGHLFADLDLHLGRAADALAFYESVEPRPRETTRQARLLGRMAGAHALLGQPDTSWALATRAGDLLDAWRRGASDERLRLYVLQKESGDRGIAQTVAALVRAGRLEEAFDLGERRRARELLDQLTRQDALIGRSAYSRSAGAAGLADVQARLDDDTALLVYVTSDGEPTSALLVTAGSVTGEILAPVDSLRPLVRELADAAEAGLPIAMPADRVASSLVPRAVGDLPDRVTRLVVVPEDVITQVPLDLLPLAGGRALLERFTTSTVPSATLGLRLLDAAPAAAAGSVLALGDAEPPHREPTAVGTRVEALPRLRGSGREARQVGRYASGLAEVRTRGAANEAFLRSADLRAFGVLHFATHAVVDPHSSRRTVIALSPAEDEDGLMTPADLAALELDAQLVVLSACASAAGETVRGEGIQGLSSALLRAGSRAVVATAWRIDDRGVRPLLERFYEALATGLPVDEALRSAKRDARDRGEPPSVWAAFTLIGDGRVTVPLRTPPSSAWWMVALAVALLGSIAVTLYARATRRRSP